MGPTKPSLRRTEAGLAGTHRRGLAAVRLVPLIALLMVTFSGRSAIGQVRLETDRLQGAWVPDGSRCGDVFFRQGKSINFVRPGAAGRDGILIQGNRIGDSRNQCTIEGVRADADRFALLLTCFSGLLVSKIAFDLRFVGEDTVVRTLSGFPEAEARWQRCKLNASSDLRGNATPRQSGRAQKSR